MKRQKEISLFIVSGRTGHSLVAAKALPFAILEQVKSIYLFSETEGFPIPKCVYITIPEWIRRIRPALIGKLIRVFYEPAQLLHYTFKLKPDFINGIYCIPKGLNSYIISRIAGVKCVNSIIGSILEIETELPFKSMWGKINLWHLRGCEAVTVKGETDAKFLQAKGFDLKKMFLFNGGIDIMKFSFAADHKTIDLLFVGSFIELKGPDRFIAIVKDLLPLFPGLRAVMVGDGPLFGKSQKEISGLGIGRNVSLEGHQTDMVTYFRNSRILVMPSRSESLPTSMIEAMACGCVPVISNVGNVREAVLNNLNAKVIDNYMDIEAYVKAVTQLLEDENIRSEFARNGRSKVESNYSVESQSVLADNIINYLYSN